MVPVPAPGPSEDPETRPFRRGMPAGTQPGAAPSPSPCRIRDPAGRPGLSEPFSKFGRIRNRRFDIS
eukprot:757939-Hanusia_phi.AAC.5